MSDETMSSRRSTKIVATLGDMSSSPATLASLCAAGVNVFRLNFSHGTREEQGARIDVIRALEAKTGAPSCILADLQGPKFRVGKVAEGVIVEAGEQITFDLSTDEGSARIVGLPHAEIFKAMYPGARLLMDDGKLVFKVVSVDIESFVAEVLVGGPLKSRKGVNLPDIVLDTTPLTEKDLADLKYALSKGVDWVALSFVQRASDVIAARTIIGKQAALMSKIEKPAALKDLNDIIAASDGVMVARGDLGVELPPEQVPGWQKTIISKCRMIGKPVVVATQMLESMIEAPTPTRAEASDVAGAVFDGADAVMLSAETAAGQYPVESVEFMARIVASAEAHIRFNPGSGPIGLPVEQSVYHAVAKTSVALAETVGAKVMVAFSSSGNTAVRIARERPSIPFLVMTPDVKVQRKLCLLWGTRSSASAYSDDFESAIIEAIGEIRNRGMAVTGQQIVVVAGMPFGIVGTTNSMRVVTL
ncbi:pyruvate kinase [Candidatus Puniceispirillum sp.]|nr:pyruvate kinase [Candidatus Puniceispirillum sp.]